MNRYDILLGKKASVKYTRSDYRSPFLDHPTELELKKMLKKPPIYGHPLLESIITDPLYKSFLLRSIYNAPVLTSNMRREKVEKIKDGEFIMMPPMVGEIKTPPMLTLLDTSV